jgi:Uma2 family endonuclease
MKLGGDRRGADVGIWRRPEDGPPRGFYDVAPVLAVEVEGRFEDEPALRDKTRWYFEHGTRIVWLVLPSRREIIVITPRGESRHGPGDMTPEHAELPGLRIPVDEVFHGL